MSSIDEIASITSKGRFESKEPVVNVDEATLILSRVSRRETNLISPLSWKLVTLALLLSSLFDEAERGDSFTTRAPPEVLSEMEV